MDTAGLLHKFESLIHPELSVRAIMRSNKSGRSCYFQSVGESHMGRVFAQDYSAYAEIAGLVLTKREAQLADETPKIRWIRFLQAHANEFVSRIAPISEISEDRKKQRQLENMYRPEKYRLDEVELNSDVHDQSARMQQCGFHGVPSGQHEDEIIIIEDASRAAVVAIQKMMIGDVDSNAGRQLGVSTESSSHSQLPLRHVVALQTFQIAKSTFEENEQPSMREIFERAKTIDDLGTDCTVDHSFETWSRYVRAGKKAIANQEIREIGKSVVKRSEI